MLACDKTITVVRYADEVYTPTVIQGVSWFEKLQVAVQDKGLAAANTFTVRIPAGQLPAGFLPQTEDKVVLGVVTAPITKPADLTAYHYFTVKGVGDNRRGPGRRPHVVVTGT